MSLKAVTVYRQEPLRVIAPGNALEKTLCRDAVPYHDAVSNMTVNELQPRENTSSGPELLMFSCCQAPRTHPSVQPSNLRTLHIQILDLVTNKNDLSTPLTTLSFARHCLRDSHHFLPRIARSNFVAIIRPPSSPCPSSRNPCTHLRSEEPPTHRKFLPQSSFATQPILLQLRRNREDLERRDEYFCKMATRARSQPRPHLQVSH